MSVLKRLLVRTRVGVILLPVVVGVGSACVESDSTTPGSTVVATSITATGPSSTTSDRPSPLSTYLGISTDVLASAGTSDPAAIATCMNERGFQYEPVRSQLELAAHVLTEPTREWMERYGFGASTLLYRQELLGSAAIGFSLEGNANPNIAHFLSLDETQRVEYQHALTGSLDGADTEPPCAFAGLADFEWATVSLVRQQFASDLAKLQLDVITHEAVVEFEASIADCLSASDLNWTNRDQAYERFLVLAARLGEDGSLSEPDLGQLADLQQSEVALAKAAWECGGSESARQVVLDAARHDLEEQFITANRSALEPLRLASFAAQGR